MSVHDLPLQPNAGSDPSFTCNATIRLAQTAVAELAMLAYPDRAWVLPAADDQSKALLNVLVVGGGQSALAIAARLKRDGVDRVLLLDAAAEGEEGVWDNFARMPELRTPKELNGMDMGLANLSVQRWYQARYGAEAWERIERIPRAAWADYLRWYRRTLALPMHNQVKVNDVRPTGSWIAVDAQTSTGPKTYRARVVVLATGFDGAGEWRVPRVVSDALPPERYNHSADAIDFARLKGRRVGVLGHGAAAFDNAVAALPRWICASVAHDSLAPIRTGMWRQRASCSTFTHSPMPFAGKWHSISARSTSRRHAAVSMQH